MTERENQTTYVNFDNITMHNMGAPNIEPLLLVWSGTPKISYTNSRFINMTSNFAIAKIAGWIGKTT